MTQADLLCVECPAVYAAPVSTQAGSAVTKRCIGEGCKSIVLPGTTTSNSDPASQLAQVLIDALNAYMAPSSTSTNNSTLDAVVPAPATGPSSSSQAGPSLDKLVSGAV
ncbi:hypothetical protein V8E53_015226 [Lactarius tabidus]